MPPMTHANLGAVPIVFVTVDTLFLVAAGLAAGGAILTGIILVRSRRRRAARDDRGVRRTPSPSSLGLPDDPIVAALVGAEDQPPRRRARRTDHLDPPT